MRPEVNWVRDQVLAMAGEADKVGWFDVSCVSESSLVCFAFDYNHVMAPEASFPPESCNESRLLLHSCAQLE